MLRRLLGPLLVVSVVMAALGVACGGDGGRPSPPATSGTRSGTTSTVGGGAYVSTRGATTASSTSTAPPALFEFVDYRVSGGTAGANDDLKIYPDGRAVYEGATASARKQITIDAGTIAALRSALEQANLPALAPVNGTASPEVLQHNVIFGGRSVRFVDGAMPPPLGAAVAILDRELARAKAA